MLRTFAAAMVAAAVTGIASTATGQTVHTYTGGATYNYGLGLHGAASGQSNRLAARPGLGYAGAGRRSGGHAGGGWFSRGFGGTLNPGWDYGFGMHMGGSGR